MVHLTFEGRSEDGARLVLADADGTEYSVEITAGLRAAVYDGSASSPTTGRARSNSQTTRESSMQSLLRPRDIQARVRAGETLESVAQAAGSSVEKIQVFAAPVLAERSHVARQALKASVRRQSEDPVGARELGEAATQTMTAKNVPADSIEWDAWRREDGRWSLVAEFAVEGSERTAEFVYDMPGNFVTLDNDDARRLVGDFTEPAVEPEPEVFGGPRRLSAVRDAQSEVAPVVSVGADVVASSESTTEEPAIGDDVIGMISTEALDATDALAAPEVPESADPEIPQESFEQPALDFSEAEPAPAPTTEFASEPEPEPEPEPGSAEPTKRSVTKKRGRASVPSWDEIMFGGGD